jgi:hypothetical protein
MTLLPEEWTLLLPFREATSKSLRVGIVLDSGRTAPWADALLSTLRRLPGIEVCSLTISGRAAAVSNQLSWLTDRLYSASRSRFDPFGALAAGGMESASSESVEAIRSAKCGLLIWLVGGRAAGLPLGGLAEHGVLTIRLGEGNRLIPFWDEVTQDRVTSTITVFWHDSSFVQGRVVCKLETSTVPGLFFTMNAEEPLVGGIRVLADLCQKVRDGGRQFEEKLRGLPQNPMETASPADYPTDSETARFILRKLARSARLRLTTRGKAARWFIAMRPNTGGSVTGPGRLDLKGFTEVPLPAGTAAMADPFLWDANGRNYLFFEEIAAGSSRGRLGCVEVFENGSCSEMKIILDRPFHLSYPCVVPSGGELFLLPESSEAGRMELYRFSRFPWEVELVSTVLDRIALVDTTPLFHEGRWYFFTSTLQPFIETVLFWADRLDGPWKLHPASPISLSVRNSRSAGNLFWRDGRLYRPTQDCSVRYGYAIQVNEVTRLTPAEFEEHAVAYVPPSWTKNLLGTHTWNENARFQVIDGIRLQ